MTTEIISSYSKNPPLLLIREKPPIKLLIPYLAYCNNPNLEVILI
mgnify:CR=1 FL=1